MNWNNLKTGMCPKCLGERLTLSFRGDVYECPRCSFRIAKWKFDNIVNAFYKKKKTAPTEDDNLSALNNL